METNEKLDSQDPPQPLPDDPLFPRIDPRASLFVKIEEGEEEIVTDPNTGLLLNDRKLVKSQLNEAQNIPSVSFYLKLSF